MKTTTFGFALLATLAGCASTVQGTSSEEDAATPDAQIASDATPTDSSITDTGSVRDAGGDSATTDTGTTADVEMRWPISASISSMTPSARTIPRNATGILAAAFDMTDAGMSIPIRMIYFRRVGVGPATDIANVYYFAVTNGSVANTPFRYSLGRAVNPMTNVISMPFEGGNLRPGATTTMLMYIDLAPGTAGAQHAFEMTGILVEDGTPDGLLVPITTVRGNPITLSGELASRLDVQRGPSIGPVRMGASGETVGTVRLRAGSHDLDLIRFSLAEGGSIEEWRELSDLELWRRQGTAWTRIPISEWTTPLNGYVVFSPVMPIYLPAGTTEDFEIRGRVTAPSGRTIRLFAEYPADVQANDRTLNVPSATCISSTALGGCDGPGEGSFDGTPGNASETVVTP